MMSPLEAISIGDNLHGKIRKVSLLCRLLSYLIANCLQVPVSETMNVCEQKRHLRK